MSNETTMTAREGRPVHETWPTFAPVCDVYENKDEILVLADLPGVTPDALRIHLEKGELSIEARRPVVAGGRGLGTEYGDVEFRRRFGVPGGIDAERISAELNNGVLHLHLPKSDALKPRRIEVRSG